MKQPKPSDRAPWADDTPAVIPPGVSVTVCPPAIGRHGRAAMPRDDPHWHPDDTGDFFSDKGVWHEGGPCDA